VAIVVAVFVLAVILAEIAADVVDSRQTAGRVVAATYVSEVIPVIDDSTMLSSTMHLVRDRAGSLGRAGLERALGDLVEGAAANLAQLASLGIPAPSARSARLLKAVLEDRASGSRDLAGAVALAIGPGGGPQVLAEASSRVVDAGKELIAADDGYRTFVSSLPRASGRSRLATSRWIATRSFWAASAAQAWVSQLSGSPQLQVHASLVIVAMTVEPPVVRINGLPTTTTAPPTTTTTTTSTTTSTTLPGTKASPTTTSTSTTTSTATTSTTTQLPPAGSTSILPPTGRISVVVVLANAGNATISDIWAAASAVPEVSTGRNAGGLTRSRSVRVGQLAPGTSVVVTVPALAVSSGRSYTLFASVGTGTLPSGPVTTSPRGPGQTDQVAIKVASG
jgi:hypothetical protein